MYKVKDYINLPKRLKQDLIEREMYTATEKVLHTIDNSK